MKTINKKLVGGLTVVMLVATIGAVFVTAQTNGTGTDTTPQKTFWGRRQMNGFGLFAANLTEEQKAELQTLVTTLKSQNATCQEIQVAIQQKLDEFGVLDKQLDNEITQTEQRLTILNREKELRTQGYNWTDIQQMIQDEFNLQNTTGFGHERMPGRGFDRGSCGGPREFSPHEKPDE